MALVVGCIIGAGIFMLPVALAPLGPNAAAGWLISGVGALCIAFALSRLVTSDGAGLQAYVERIFGPTTGFVVGWSFYVSQCSTNAALAIAAASAVAWLNPGVADPWSIALMAVTFVAFLTGVNALGVRAMGRLAVLTTLIKVLPLFAAIALVGIGYGEGRQFEVMAPVPLSFNTIAIAAALALYALLGFENATVPVGKVRDPTRLIPRSILIGTAFVAMLYLLSSTSVVMLLSPEATARSTAPFADALATRWGEPAAIFAALGMAISAFGCLNAGIMVTGELGYAMAVRHDLPKAMARTRGINTPYVSQIVGAALCITLVMLNSSKTTAGLFTFIILLSTVSVLVVYVIGSLAAWTKTPRPFPRSVIVVGIIFAVFAFYGSGLEANLWGIVLLAGGLAIRMVMHRINAASRSIPAPAERPA